MLSVGAFVHAGRYGGQGEVLRPWLEIHWYQTEAYVSIVLLFVPGVVFC